MERVLEITVPVGSVGEEHYFEWHDAANRLIAPADVTSVSLALADAEGTSITPNGSALSAGSVPPGFSFGWKFGSTEVGTARTLYGRFTVNKGGGAVKRPKIVLRVVT